MRVQEANSEQEKSRDEVTYAEWGKKLDLPRYLERGRYFRAHPWIQANMKTWLLLDDSDRILSSCETYRMTSLFTPPEKATDSESPNAAVWGSRGTTFAIASVFTEDPHRRKGYASRMLSLLAENLFANPDSPQGLILFSDVGEKLYHQVGYQPVPSFDWVLSPDSRFEFPQKNQLSQPAFLRIWEGVQTKLGSLKAKSPFLVLPSLGQLDWHFSRERFYRQSLYSPTPEIPQIVGAQVGNSVIAWEADYRAEYLQIVLLHSECDADTLKLLSFARRRAFDLKLSGVHIWESEDLLEWQILESISAIRENRIEHLPMLRSNIPKLDSQSWRIISRAIWV